MNTGIELSTALIKQKALELGFAACGVAAAGAAQTTEYFQKWLAAGFQADMNWIARPDAVTKRGDLRHILPGAKSVVCVALHYRTEEDWDAKTHGNVARYARGRDYHDFFPKRLRELLNFIQEQALEQGLECNGKVYSDTGPILEREWAQRAGLGWIGKNSMLLSRELGSYFLLGEIILDIELEADRPHVDEFCGSCTRCIEACPTDALTEPRVVDANRCISYQTIENREGIAPALQPLFGDWIFGCDICQEVCPWNNKSTHRSEEDELWTRPEFPTLLEWVLLPQDEFSRRMTKSPLKRPKLKGMQRNAEIAIENKKDK